MVRRLSKIGPAISDQVIESRSDEYALKKREGGEINFRGTRMTAKVSGKQSGRAYSLVEMTPPPNVGPALHIHPKAPEAYYVLDGEYAIKCCEKLIQAKTSRLYSSQKDVVRLPVKPVGRQSSGYISCRLAILCQLY